MQPKGSKKENLRPGMGGILMGLSMRGKGVGIGIAVLVRLC